MYYEYPGIHHTGFMYCISVNIMIVRISKVLLAIIEQWSDFKLIFLAQTPLSAVEDHVKVDNLLLGKPPTQDEALSIFLMMEDWKALK